MRKYRIVLGILAVIFFIGCNDNYPEISEGLFEKDKMDVIKDSLVGGQNIEAYTVSDEDAYSYNVNRGLLGVHNDAVFGKTKSGFAFQYRTLNQYIEDGASVDSAFIKLSYNKSYHDSTFIQNLNIYRLINTLEFKGKYRANEEDKLVLGEKIISQGFNYEEIADSTIVVTEKTLEIKSKTDPEKDSVEIHIDTLISNYLQIRIPEEFTQRVFINEANNAYEGQDEFLEYFKGIYIDVDDHSEEGGLYSFNLSEINQSRLLVHYSYPDPVLGRDTTSFFRFFSNENSARVNFVTHDYTGSEVGSVIGDRGDVEESEKLYIKGAAGTKAKLYIPEINNWKDSTDVAINKAELVLNISQGYDTIVPDKLVLAVLNNDSGTPEMTPEYVLNTIDGNYNQEDKTYRFNLTFYLQQLIRDRGNTLNKGFLIYPSNRREDPRGVVIANPNEANGTDKRIKLSITYTKIK